MAKGAKWGQWTQGAIPLEDRRWAWVVACPFEECYAPVGEVCTMRTAGDYSGDPNVKYYSHPRRCRAALQQPLLAAVWKATHEPS